MAQRSSSPSSFPLLRIRHLVFIVALWCGCCLHNPVAALPFRTRGKHSSEDDEGGNDGGKAKDAPSNGSKIQIQPATANGDKNAAGGEIDNSIIRTFFETHKDEDDALRTTIRERAQQLNEFLVATRRSLHKHPEVMYNEEHTSLFVQEVLTQQGIAHTTGWAVNTVPDIIPGKGGYGVVADIGTGQPPCVLLRADMDALPILEKTQHIDSFKSANKGEMHACGHDGHTTMLLGAAVLLKEMESTINGTIRIMFQPAEEGGAGAKRMREEGVLETPPRPQLGFGLHVWPTIPSGVIASRPGPILAACERFEIVVTGVGGHAAMPHLTVDPVVAASSMVMNLQTLVSRTLSPLESGVCSITAFQAGSAFNVIPATALLRGTIRALSTETLLSLRDKVHHVVHTQAAVHGCNVTITYSPDFYPPTINDPQLFDDFSKSVGALVAEDGQLTDIEPTMGAEDFSFVAESIPSTFFLLGQGSGMDPPTNYGLHHPNFALDESVMHRGVELHVNLALRGLVKLAMDLESSSADESTASEL